MASTLIVLAVIVVLAYRATTPEDRQRYYRAAIAALVPAAARLLRQPASSFRDALRARTPRLIITPALVVLNVVVFARLLTGAGALGDPATLIAWGGNFGPRTTNGEWWRLITSAFVHAGFFTLLVNLAALAQIGSLVERLVGRAAIATVYLVAAVFAGLVSVSVAPVTVTAGASGAIAGLYGLLVPVAVWAGYRGSDAAVPISAVRRLAPVAGVFLLFNLFAGNVPAMGEVAGFIAGLVCGGVLAIDVADRTAPVRHVAAAAAIALVIAVLDAVPLRGMTDARPEVARVAALETTTAAEFQKRDDEFRAGRLSGRALAQVIDQSIVPELQAADTRLKALHHVPPEHQPLVQGAEEYLRLRVQSWQLRSEWLRQMSVTAVREVRGDDPASSATSRARAEAQHRSTSRMLGRAETAERASLDVLRSVSGQDPK